jgi:hypothetical protein
MTGSAGSGMLEVVRTCEPGAPPHLVDDQGTFLGQRPFDSLRGEAPSSSELVNQVSCRAHVGDVEAFAERSVHLP